jgi:hypothetical protein
VSLSNILSVTSVEHWDTLMSLSESLSVTSTDHWTTLLSLWAR